MEQQKNEVWSREFILDEENKILHQIMSARTPEAVEACISYARFLKMSGLTSENYPLFLKMLEIENHWVLDELIGKQDPFLLLSTIPPNRHIVATCFKLLTKWRAGGIYPKTRAIVLGVLQNAYSSPKDGYKIFPLTIADVNNLGKHLDQDEGQNDEQNRCILDILEKVSSLEGLKWDESMLKFVIIFHRPADIDDFEQQYNNLLKRIEQMPGIVRRQVANVVGSPNGQSPYNRILEVYYNNRREMELSLQTPMGQDAGRQLATLPEGSYEMVFAEVYEEDGGWPTTERGED